MQLNFIIKTCPAGSAFFPIHFAFFSVFIDTTNYLYPSPAAPAAF